MSGNDIKPSSRVVNQGEVFEADGGILEDRPPGNAALIFFQRVGRAFSDLGGMISRAFSNVAESFRGAFAHVSNMICGVDRDTALRNVTEPRPRYWTYPIDLDEEESGDENFDANIGEVSEQSLVEDKNVKKTDFSEMISPPVTPTSTELPKAISQTTESPTIPAALENTVSENTVSENLSSFFDLEMSHAEKLFAEFSGRYQAAEGFSIISSDEPALLDPSCLEVARSYQKSHPEHPDILYSDGVQKKRKAATALLNADIDNKARAREKDRLAQEAKKKAEELARREALPAGQADFEDFLSAFKAAEPSGRPYQFAQGSKFLGANCTQYAQQRLLQSPPKKESAAIKILLEAAGAIVPEQEKVLLETDVSALPSQPVSAPSPPAAPSTPRWMSTLSSILGSTTDSRDEMPDVFAAMLMPNHGMEDRNLAWQGLYLLLSPIGKNISSAIASENEVALNYQNNLVPANEDSLRRLELARQLIVVLEGLNIDEALSGVQVTRPSDEQVKAIRRLQSNVPALIRDLEDRINVLSPAKTTVVTLPSKIPTLDSLSPRAFTSASDDFNAFVKQFASLSEQQKLQYQFVGDRAKYSRPNCAAIAQSVITSYKGLYPKDMIKEDQDRLSAAEFMISEFNKKNPST